jgi:hypothetical protein
MDRKKAIVLLCASMMSEVIIHQFSKDHHTFVDMGSVLDIFVGKPSRRYHHKLLEQWKYSKKYPDIMII